MSGVEVGGRWESYLAKEKDSAEQAAARQTEREVMEARRVAAYVQAASIIAQVGASEHKRGEVTQEQRTPLIALGSLDRADEQGRDHGFALVFVDRDIRLRKDVTKGLFFKRVTLTPEVTDTVSRFGIVLYAGREDGTDTKDFDWAGWSITERGYEKDVDLAKLEDLLRQTTEAIPIADTQPLQ